MIFVIIWGLSEFCSIYSGIDVVSSQNQVFPSKVFNSVIHYWIKMWLSMSILVWLGSGPEKNYFSKITCWLNINFGDAARCYYCYCQLESYQICAYISIRWHIDTWHCPLNERTDASTMIFSSFCLFGNKLTVGFAFHSSGICYSECKPSPEDEARHLSLRV